MNTPNAELMLEAREALDGKWGLAVGTFLVLGLITGVSQSVPIIGWIGALVIGGPFALGSAIFSLSLSRREDARLEQIFEGFKRFETALGAYLLSLVYVLLWSLLFVIPGIITAISYSQVFFIIAEDDTITSDEALVRSKEMMDGHKAKYFRMMLRFVGWSMLCVFTLGIGFFFLAPYVQVSLANFHQDINDDFEVRSFYRDDILDEDLV